MPAEVARLAAPCLYENDGADCLSDCEEAFLTYLRRRTAHHEAATGPEQDRPQPGRRTVTQPLHEMGIVLRSRSPGEHRAPCPECAKVKARPHDAALAARLEPDGRAIWSCHRCGWKGAIGRVDDQPTRAPKPPVGSRGDLRAGLAALPSASQVEPGTVAAAYLTARGCALPHPAGDLRYLEQHRHPCGHVGPAMIALLTDVITAKPQTVHQTWILADGTEHRRQASLAMARLAQGRRRLPSLARR